MRSPLGGGGLCIERTMFGARLTQHSSYSNTAPQPAVDASIIKFIEVDGAPGYAGAKKPASTLRTAHNHSGRQDFQELLEVTLLGVIGV